jgi:hypothetical protein
VPFTQGHALLIGVGSYESEPRLSVPITAADAEALAAVLRDPALCLLSDAKHAPKCITKISAEAPSSRAIS